MEYLKDLITPGVVGARIRTNSERKSGWGFMSSVLEQEVDFSEAPGRAERNSGLHKGNATPNFLGSKRTKGQSSRVVGSTKVREEAS